MQGVIGFSVYTVATALSRTNSGIVEVILNKLPGFFYSRIKSRNVMEHQVHRDTLNELKQF